jgi:hypothetical protein
MARWTSSAKPSIFFRASATEILLLRTDLQEPEEL